jgi:hypothetical protein
MKENFFIFTYLSLSKLNLFSKKQKLCFIKIEAKLSINFSYLEKRKPKLLLKPLFNLRKGLFISPGLKSFVSLEK